MYQVLREAIIAAELEPGQQLSENELASRLGVSRTPLREALVRLRDDRLVENVPQLGTFVTHISVPAVQDAQFVREALECAAIKLCAKRAQDEDVKQLRANIQRQAQARAAEDFAGFYALDDVLHQTLSDLSGHGIAWSLSQRANGHLNRIRRLSLPIPSYLDKMIEEHRSVVDAVGAHDSERAERALRYHLRMVLSGLGEIEKKHPEYFENLAPAS